MEIISDGVNVLEGDKLEVTDSVGVEESDAVELRDVDGLAVSVAVGEIDLVREREMEDVVDGELETVRLLLGVGVKVVDGDTVADAAGVSVAVVEVDSLGLCDDVGASLLVSDCVCVLVESSSKVSL